MATRLTHLLLLLFALGVQAEEITGKVIGVSDSDTLTVLVDKAQIKVRLAEIDTPELGQAFGQQAKKALADLVFGKQVSIIVTDQDRYGRSLGVYAFGLDVNKALVRLGLAWAYLQYQRDATFSDLEAEARAKTAACGRRQKASEGRLGAGGEKGPRLPILPVPVAASKATSAAAGESSTTCRTAERTDRRRLTRKRVNAGFVTRKRHSLPDGFSRERNKKAPIPRGFYI